MPKRRNPSIQRRERASADALDRRLNEPSGVALPDWRLLAIGGVLVVGVVLVVLVLVLSGGPSTNVGVAQANDGQTHVTAGINCRITTSPAEQQQCGGADPYSSLPGTSGPHWPPDALANWGVYTTPQPETQVIHNLEHGGIVIWYDSARVDEGQVDELARFVNTQVASGISGRFKFILTPWDGGEELPAPIVLTAWRNLLELEEVDIGAIEEFSREHYGMSPEPNGGPGPPT